MRRKLPHVLPLNVPSEISYVGEDDSEYFTELHGRKMNSMNTRYMLPADADEIRVSLGLAVICSSFFSFFLSLSILAYILSSVLSFITGCCNSSSEGKIILVL